MKMAFSNTTLDWHQKDRLVIKFCKLWILKVMKIIDVLKHFIVTENLLTLIRPDFFKVVFSLFIIVKQPI